MTESKRTLEAVTRQFATRTYAANSGWVGTAFWEFKQIEFSSETPVSPAAK